MFKLFMLGVFAGLAGAAALLYVVPVVNLDREVSIISVQPNGGNREEFHVNLPGDRLMAGVGGQAGGFPAEIDWPDHLDVEPSQTELFKVRNSNDRVIGIASRLAAGGAEPFVEWVVHLPARGTMYLHLDSTVDDGGVRRGSLRGGTAEFETRRGNAAEQFVAADGDAAGDDRLLLVTALVGRLEDLPEPIIEEGAL